MAVSDKRDDPRMGDGSMAEQALPECGEHCGTCARCGVEIRTKPRARTVKGTEERAARKTVSIRLPEGVSGEDWDELLAEAESVELQQQDTPFDAARGGVAIGKLLVTVLERFTGRIG
jgi:DnaJ-class molecular chaperone